MIFANLWLFKGALNLLCKKSGGEINALMRTTVAFTQMSGSKGINVLPPVAYMRANLRLIEGDTMDSALEEIRKKANDEGIKVSKISGMNPSRISSVDCEAYNKVAIAVASTWRDAIVSPYLMVQCSDCRHYGRITDKVYRFSAMDLTKEERATIHGNDEKIRIESIVRATEFFTRLASKL
jgi:carboxypeptidase PM20D1